ncbi:Plasmodium exported protein (PHISTa), unknown function [Plasmodium sp.]|nr:Plasmodium exported protein (PHISTa), unknown function [Plasmodium sp.]
MVNRNLSEYYIGIYRTLSNYYHKASGVYKKYYSGKLMNVTINDSIEENMTHSEEDSNDFEESSKNNMLNELKMIHKEQRGYKKRGEKKYLIHQNVDSIIKTLNNTDANKHNVNDSNNKFKAPLRILNYNDFTRELNEHEIT